MCISMIYRECKIPKVIHLCWFSGDKYPKMVEKCIDSWKNVLPDFSIKVWTSEMAKETKIPYVLEAIKVKKWAFAADVIRLHALYTEGGIYMDSDILVKRRFDQFMNNRLVMFQEYHKHLVSKIPKEQLDYDGRNLYFGKNVCGIGIQAAFFMSEKGHPFLKELLDYYTDRHFILEDNSYDVNLIAPDIYAMSAEKHGYRYVNEKQDLGEGIFIYPSNFVAGGLYENSKEAFAVHCILHSWFEDSFWVKFKKSIKRFVKNDDPIRLIDSIINEKC